METYRDILCRQVDTLQVYFDTLAEANAQGTCAHNCDTIDASVSAFNIVCNASTNKNFSVDVVLC